MSILVLDPGSSTGYALAKVSDDKTSVDIYEYGFIDVCLDSDFQGDHCVDLMKKIRKIIKKHNVNYIAREDYFFSKRTANGSNVNSAFRTAIDILASQYKIPCYVLNITNWKKYISGRVKPLPSQIKIWGKEPAKKLMIQQSLWEKYQIRFPNHSYSQKTRKPIAFRYDVVDAVGQMIYFSSSILGIKNVTCSVSLPDDIEIKTKKKLFQYPDKTEF